MGRAQHVVGADDMLRALVARVGGAARWERLVASGSTGRYVHDTRVTRHRVVVVATGQPRLDAVGVERSAVGPA